MKNITLNFEFADMRDAMDFMERVNGITLDPDEPINMVPTKPAASIPEGPDKVDGGTPNIDSDTGKKITGKKIKAELSAYKEAHGHKAYKELLAYFGVTAVRDIPKKDYAAVLSMTKGQDATNPGNAIAPAPTIPDMDDNGLDTPGMDDNGLDVPTVTAEQLRDALSEHKSRWGLDATVAIITRLGYSTPNDIPADKYGEVFMAISSDDPAADTVAETPDTNATGVDLSMF